MRTDEMVGRVGMRLVVLVMTLLLGPGAAVAQDLSALARLVPEQSWVSDHRGAVDMELALSQPVPWRVRVLDAPPRLVLDTREVDWTGLASVDQESTAVLDMRAGMVRQGWSRLVMELSGPFLVAQADMRTGEAGAKVRLRLISASAEEFAAAAALPEPAGWALPEVA
ncbi:MAG: AMIN domain-containing protein, partial [Pseudorhodobacter sp.]|nr:AMIN domain-containing protein [Pseudorhodobacter sp.]